MNGFLTYPNMTDVSDMQRQVLNSMLTFCGFTMINHCIVDLKLIEN